MGAKDSKLTCILYEDAIKRVSDSEFRRIKEAFKRSAGTNGTLLSKNAFLQDVLCEGVPDLVADWLYNACGGSGKGIGFKELFCGLVLITRGQQDEKIRFLFQLYSNDSVQIHKNDFQKSLQVEATYQSNNSLPPPTSRNSHSKDLTTFNHISLFGSGDRVTFDQFRSWILMHKHATVLSKWLLVDSCVNLSSELETPTFYQSLAGVTHLEENDIGDLEKIFWQLKNDSLSAQLDIESLGPLISPPIPKNALAGIFLAFDENRDGHIDFKELCCGVSAACRGPTVERSKFCFKIFDIDRDGYLNEKEIEQMVQVLLLVSKESNSNLYRNYSKEQIMHELFNNTMKGVTSVEAKEKTDEQQAPLPLDFKLSQENFLVWSVESQLNIVQPFLDLLFEVCHIVFGLRPQCKHLEFEIVRGWLSREVRRGYEVGQFWYLISSEWWQNWLQYTQGSSNLSPCSHCKSVTNYRSLSITNGPESVDEAMACDESFTSNVTESLGDLLGAGGDSSSLGSGSSGISLGRNQGPPGQIDNSSLLAPLLHKNVNTLTGEGGRLKPDIKQHRDYELVPDRLWRALATQWYGGNLSLPRQVIKPLSGEIDKEIEMYPLNLRILRHQSQNTTQQTQSNSSTWNNISGGYGSLSSASYSNVSANISSSLQSPKKYLAYTGAFSRLSTVKKVGEFLCQRLKLRYEDIRLWHVQGPYPGSTHDVPCLLEEDTQTLQDITMNDNDQILLEIRNNDQTWIEDLCRLSLSPAQNNVNTERRPTIASVQSMHAPGATGLHNLGNTCFMNSALQVLFNTQPLSQYFRQNMHLYELNTNNKMGTKGQLALRYAELLKEIWTASSRSIAPLKFRFCVTKHATQFGGGNQHDTQEFLNYLLDSLHEDLNRVTEKPYAELKDSNNRPDCEVAAEAWQQHHARNQSIIVDLFYGQLKSKVSCLTCGHESVRFDPFSLLSLPLPMENYTYCEVLVTMLDGSRPVKYGVRLNSDCNYWDLKNHLVAMCGLDPHRMLICELSNSQIKCILPNEQKIKPATAAELYVYELPKLDQRSRAGSELGANIEKGLKDIQRNNEQHQMTITSTSSTSSDDANDKSKNSEQTSKNSADISTSPMSSFLNSANGPSYKTISTVNLLSTSESSDMSDVQLSQIKKTPKKEQNVEKENSCSSCNNVNGKAISNEGFCDASEDDTNASIKHCVNYDTKSGYMIAVHRKLTPQDIYFMSNHKSRPSLFGVPLLIPLYVGVKNKDLYCSVWLQVARLLSPLPPTPPDQANHATDCDDSLGYDFPFTLRAVAENGRVCALCHWPRFCRGCTIPCNEEPLLHGIISTSCASSNASTPNLSTREGREASTSSMPIKLNIVINSNSINIAIDWDPTALHLRYQSTREKIWTEHSSVAVCRKQQFEPVDLDHCLRVFTTEEKLEQTYYCSNCKGKQPATKKLQIWKLPPVLIVHLKRFNFVNNKWVKSQKVVNFPFQDFDPTPYLASVPQETILRHKDLLEQQAANRNLKNFDCNEEISEFDMEADLAGNNNSNAFNNLNLSRTCDTIKENSNSETKNEEIEDDVCVSSASTRKVSHMVKGNPRKRLVSTSLSRTPIVDGEFIDYNNHKLKTSQDPFDLKYQLYAAVSHSGMLNGGHYVSYASNSTGSWYCFNDSSCREIPQRPNIDPSSAYLLFYERQNLDYAPYLPNLPEGKPLVNGNVIDAEETDNDLRKMCVLS